MVDYHIDRNGKISALPLHIKIKTPHWKALQIINQTDWQEKKKKVKPSAVQELESVSTIQIRFW